MAAHGDGLEALLDEVTALYGDLVRVSEYTVLAKEAKAAIEEMNAAVAAFNEDSGERELRRVRNAAIALKSIAAKMRQARQR